MTGITWLASYPKSGNTWMRAFLDAYLRDAVPDINDLRTSEGDNHPYVYQQVSPVPLAQLPAVAKLMLRPAALLHLLHLHGERPPVLLKTHNANVDAAGIPLIPPELTQRVIYIARDPRDLVISLARHMGLTPDEAIAKMSRPAWTIGAGDRVPHVVNGWSDHVLGYLQSDELLVHVVRYEEMLQEPERVFTDVLSALNIEADRERLARAIQLSSFDVLAAQEAKHGFRERSAKTDGFFCRGTAGHWREVLTPEQARLIEQNHHRAMNALGYLHEWEDAA